MTDHTNEKDQNQPGKHQGEWRRCQTCGAPENDHPYRHPFKAWQPGRGRATSPGEQAHGHIVVWREGDVDKNGDVRPRYVSGPVAPPEATT